MFPQSQALKTRDISSTDRFLWGCAWAGDGGLIMKLCPRATQAGQQAGLQAATPVFRQLGGLHCLMHRQRVENQSANSCSSRKINLGGTIRAWNWSEESVHQLMSIFRGTRAPDAWPSYSPMMTGTGDPRSQASCFPEMPRPRSGSGAVWREGHRVLTEGSTSWADRSHRHQAWREAIS